LCIGALTGENRRPVLGGAVLTRGRGRVPDIQLYDKESGKMALILLRLRTRGNLNSGK